MANVNGPFGLKPLRYRSGLPYNDAATLYYIPSSNASNLFIGDPVVKITGGNAVAYYGNPVGSLAQVQIATAGVGNAITGVIVGFFPEQATSPVYLPTGTARGVYIADDPNLVFAIQDDGVVATDYTWTSANANLLLTTAGSTITGLSGAQLSTATKYVAATGSSATAQLKIHRLRPIVNNNTGANAVWEVTINQHTEGYGAGTGTTITTGAPGF